MIPASFKVGGTILSFKCLCRVKVPTAALHRFELLCTRAEPKQTGARTC
jgi:hypothetical protein